MPNKIYYYGPPPSREDMERGFNVLKFGIGCLLFVGFWGMVIGGLWSAIGAFLNHVGAGGLINRIGAFFEGIGQHNTTDLLVLLLLLSLVCLALFWAVFVMKRRENKIGCIAFIALCLVILVGSIGISGWELLQSGTAHSNAVSIKSNGLYKGESWTGQLDLYGGGGQHLIPATLTIQSIEGGGFKGTIKEPCRFLSVGGTFGSSISKFSSDVQSELQDVISSYGDGEYVEFTFSSDTCQITHDIGQFTSVLGQNGELNGNIYPLNYPFGSIGTFNLQKVI